ncbi:MAG TPA: family 20 glycosylhydrolase, partial [Gemmatimonadaceae bacterium]
ARVDSIVRAAGKVAIGWGEISPAAISPTTIVQHWRRDSATVHVARGGRVILSPGTRMYLDMKYDSSTVLGLRWAGLVSVRTAYDWDPATLTPGIGEPSILGVEAPLWSETLARFSDVEFMAFPRIAAVAEVGWSAQDARGWDAFRRRLAAHGPRLRALGINFYPSPEIDWLVQ